MAEQEEETPTKIIHADIKHEIGVMVGFMAIMGIAAITFLIAWRVYNKRQEKREEARKAGLIERGFGETDLEKGNGKYADNDWERHEERLAGIDDRREDREEGIGRA